MKPRNLGAIVAASMLVACADTPTDPPNADGNDSTAQLKAEANRIRASGMAAAELRAAQSGRQQNIEDDMLRLEAEAPGFGGFYVDTATGRTIVVVAGQTGHQRAINAVRGFAARANAPGLNRLASGSMEVRTGQFPFSTLHAWKSVLLQEMLTIDGFLSIDADERANRITVEVANAQARSEVEKALEVSGAPAGVAQVVVGSPMIALQAWLQYPARPTMGGFQISFRAVNVGQFQLCTLGWNVTTSLGESGFLTAGHCQRGAFGNGVTGDSMFQAAVPSEHVGYVSINPAWTGLCTNPDDPGGPQVRCTPADVMLVSYKPGVTGDRRVSATNGREDFNNRAGTRKRSTSFGSISMNGTPVVGWNADKVGRTTGWTRGSHDQTCATVLVNGNQSNKYVVPCAHRIVNAAVGTGDSGAPVFQVIGSNIAFLGVLFAGGPLYASGPEGTQMCSWPYPFGMPEEARCRYIYSDYTAIKQHLGRDFSAANP